MIGFVEYLINEKHYIVYDWIYNKSTKQYTAVQTNNFNHYSSIDRIDIRLVHVNDDPNDVVNHIVYGLNEHPPTLIFPRPVENDFEMDRLFVKYSYEEIYNLIMK